MEMANGEERANARKKKKSSTPEGQFQQALAACSRNNDLPGALALYQAAVAGNTRLTAYHFNTLLHICSSSLGSPGAAGGGGDTGEGSVAVDAAFRVFDHMVASGIHPAEATITSMARIAAANKSDGGDVAFELVRDMGTRYGVSPRLRTYGPALFAFCRRVEDTEKAYVVEEHMISMGISPEEQELAALLKVSSEASREEKAYEYLQKLRRYVGCVSLSTAEIVERWFGSEQAAEVGRENWDVGRVKDSILTNGGGWHGNGWLGKGKWGVRRSKVAPEGFCLSCGEQLACVDIDRVDTEKFAESVASLAMEREVKSNFRDFQEWLNDHADYEAIVDAANVGYYQQNFADGGYCLSQVETVVRELSERRQGKLPLVILHNKRVITLMENPCNRQLLDEWKSQGTLYSTPNGSNDDWYWLYAAVKLKCLLVTNDEMRDHIFELLGRNFFSKWKERHQVRYTFLKGHLKLEMPPPYSTVIQESEVGSWHVPLDDKCKDESLRTWLCINRYDRHRTSDEANPVIQPTQPSTNSTDECCVITENVNALQKNSTWIQLTDDDEPTSVLGKRTDRSSSP